MNGGPRASRSAATAVAHLPAGELAGVELHGRLRCVYDLGLYRLFRRVPLAATTS